MSKNETPFTRKFWSETGGLLIEEFHVIKGGSRNTNRWIDGLIVLGEENQIHPGKTFDITGKDVIIIQTKNRRLGMGLIGQALLSRMLVEEHHKPASVRTVAVCINHDEILGPLAERLGVEVVVYDRHTLDRK